YGLRLVQADGTPAPPILCLLAGTPALYLTATAVFTGPEPHPQVLDAKRENRIPAPAIEQLSGVAFLQSLGVDLPPRLRERVRTLPFQVAIHCRLQPVYLGSDTEECVVSAFAEAPDGHALSWTGY